MSVQKFDAAPFAAMFQASHAAIEAQEHARRANENAVALRRGVVVPELGSNKLWRIDIGVEDVLYAKSREGLPIPSTYIGKVAFARRIVVPFGEDEVTDHVLFTPMIPDEYDKDESRMLTEQAGGHPKVCSIGLGWMALQNVQTISFPQAKDELHSVTGVIFNPNQVLVSLGHRL